ncbi:X-linked retinitis pigmentosa GTPase regulator [Bombus impatiens]|uniref:X-linked retinitis pigmentosa GTPase regulator n=1 Tax=Bombus impatiens TaxID=132113 RepID=A0A6P6FE42_BOMIM|nr:X-linked retinitis pigmentosa GTPase regulator [Bombus impatiens]
MGLTDLETIPETGAVFTIGRSRFADNVASHFFIRRDPVLSITCGDEHSAVICQTGRLFVFGSNDWGQLGLGHKNHISKPSCVKALKPERVTHVACGRAHTLICTGSQKIFACGSDQEGQLGRGISAIGDSVNTPVLVYDSGLSGSKIVQIAAGSHHSLALTSDGGVFAWGSNLEGQLGLPDVSGLVNKPTKVHIPEPVKQISAGYYHSTFLTESGLVYVCGESESGKLGIDASFSTQVAPKQMQLPSPAVHVACGGHHTVILAENGNLYCTGSNSSGQLGLGTNLSELHIPKLLPRGMLRNETITRISCGESHTAVVTESGKLYTCGDGRHGKLGLEENENNVHELTFVQRYKELFVSDVACGGCHTILVGQRRDTNNRSQKEDNSQTEHIQKRNSLPPLKLPVNRLQSETHDENVNEIIKDRLNQGNNITESVTNAQEAVETSMETIEENIKNKVDDVTNNVIDSMNNIEKSDSPQNSPEKSTNDKPEEISSNAVSNEENAEMTSKEMSANIGESEESKLENENSVLKKEEEESTMKTNVKSENVQKEKRSESMDKEENNEGNNNETTTETTINNMGSKEEITIENGDTENKDETDGKRKNSEDVKTEPMEESMEPSNGDDTKLETSPEKQTSPSDSTPPPKPPRLKSTNENSSTDNEKTSSMERENEIKTEDTPEKKPEAIEGNESEKKKGSGSMKSTRSSGSIKSTRSRVNMEDTIEIDKQTDKAKIIEEEKMNNDNVQDDADVQSPPPRTGKMSKIFKSKKPQATENGTKTTGIANQKSKVCIALCLYIFLI